jgi:hypothetical protein
VDKETWYFAVGKCSFENVDFLKKENCSKEKNSTNAVYLEKEVYSEFHHLYEELRNNSTGPQLIHGYARMLPDTFDYIVNAVRDELD